MIRHAYRLRTRSSFSVAVAATAASRRCRLAATSTSAAAAAVAEQPGHPTADRRCLFLTAVAYLTAGICLGRWSAASHHHNNHDDDHVLHDHHPHQRLPDGQPRTCCEESSNTTTTTTSSSSKLTPAQQALPAKLRQIVGVENVLDGLDVSSPQATVTYLQGARLGGGGKALCIVTPRKLHHVVPLVRAVLAADGVVIVPQGQNTGLTGGSVPRPSATKEDDDDDDGDAIHNERPTVLLSMKYLDAIVPLDQGQRMICFAGTGLATLASFLDEHFNRESHSTLGSTFLNPTVAAGVAFGSGGTMCRKGPAYTERALYVKVDEDKWGRRIVRVVNTLDVDGLEDREEKLGRNYRPVMDSVPYRLDTFGKYIKAGDKDMYYTTDHCQRAASDTGYAERLCQKEEDASSSSSLSNVVNRSNADTHGPECCRCEGKVIVLATVHDTFPKPKSTKTFWLSFDSLELAQQFREQVALDNKNDVPIALEYLNQDAYEVIDQSGRFLAHCIHRIGMTSPLLRHLWHAKLYLEAAMQKPGVVDQAWHDVNEYLPSVLPEPIQQMANVYEHHAMLTIGEFGNGEMDRFLARMEQFVADANSNNNPNAKDDSSSPSSSTDINQGSSSSKTWKQVDRKGSNRIKVYECQTPDEASRLSAVRFVAAPAFRTWCVAHGVSGFSVDYALPGRGRSIPTVPIAPLKRMRYSHFACNVVHEDIAYPIDHDIDAIKHALKKTVEIECGGRLPAEHGHGTEYVAPPEVQERWKKMDPLNVLNPGIGGLARGFRYREE